MNPDLINLIICGVGGQGNILASQLVAAAGIKKGLHVAIGETYGASQRGGSVMSHIRFSTAFSVGPLIPKGQVDIIVGFEPLETLRVLLEYGKETTRVVFNPRPNYPISVLSGDSSYPPLDLITTQIKNLAASSVIVEATELAKAAGNHLASNLVMVGALAGSQWLNLPLDYFHDAIAELFEDQKKRSLNLRAFEAGITGFKAANP